MLAGMNQLWRRNISKADKAGVEVVDRDAREDLKAFHDLYVHTAERDHFTPRPLAYFQTMYDALGAEDPDRITPLARPPRGRPRRGHDRGPGRRARVVLLRRLLHRQARGPRLQRRAVGDDPRRARRRAPTSTTCAASPTPSTPTTPTSGLIQFKVGTGGEAVEYVGEWDLPLNRALYKAFALYLNRRSADPGPR